MENILILLGIAYLASPLVLIGVAVAHRRRLRRLEEDLDVLEKRIAALGGSRAGAAPSEQTPVVEPIIPVAPPVQTVELPRAPVPEVFIAPPPTVAARVPASVPAAGEPPPVERRPRLVPLLRGIGLWPPAAAEGEAREGVLMQWWLPRAGGLLALLSALFFGVYINQSTSALFKVAELVTVSIGIAALGRFLERRYRAFGGVLLVTGLIMLYLTSVGAYVLPALRVIESPLAGSLVQAAVLAAICVVGLSRRSAAIVFLAHYFGFFLGVFMAWEGLREGALIAAALLFLAGALMARMPLYRNLVTVIIPGSFAAALAFPAIGLWRTVELPGQVPLQVFVNAVLAGVALLYLLGMLGEGRRARILLAVGTSLAIAATVWFFRAFAQDALEWALLVLGGNMLAFAVGAWSLRGCGYLVQLMFVKGSFLVASWAVLHFAGDLRWMVLALQTVVMACSARRARQVAMEAAVWVVAIASLVLYNGALISVPAALSFTWWMMAAYPAVLLLAVALLLRVLDAPGFLPREAPRKWLYGLVPVIACLLWYRLFRDTPQRGFDESLPFLVILYASAALGLVPLFSRFLMLLMAGLSFIAGSLLFCTAPFSPVLLGAIVLAAGAVVHFLRGRPERAALAAINAAYFLALLPASLWLLQVMNDWDGQVAAAYGFAAALLCAGLVRRLPQIGAWSALPVVVLFLTEEAPVPAGAWSLASYAAGLAWLMLPSVLPGLRRGLGWAERHELWSLLAALFFWLCAARFGDPQASWISGQSVFGVIALLLIVAAWRWKAPGYYLGALLFAASVALRHLGSLLNEAGAYAPWSSEALVSAALLYAFALAWFLLKPEPSSIHQPAIRQRFDMLVSAASSLLIFLTSVVTFHYSELGLRSWYTPALAMTSFGIILLGLFRSDAVYRRIGLASLLVPLVRLFVVDVQDALYRIIAFAAAALLLTLLGYLYNRLSARLGGR